LGHSTTGTPKWVKKEQGKMRMNWVKKIGVGLLGIGLLALGLNLISPNIA
jgi:hypothetical protein